MFKIRVLITGGAGMIGSHAAEYYAKKGNNVVILDNLMRSKLFGSDKKSVEYNWNYLEKYPNITRIRGDVRNDKDVLKAIGDDVDAVIHTAAQPGVPSSMKMPKEDFSINAFGTVNVLEHLRQKCDKAAFVYCSTNKVYGENVDRIPIEEKETRYVFKDLKGVDEQMPIDHTGHSPYGASKYVGDLYTQEYGSLYGMKTCCFRMSCIYGRRQFGFEDQGWVAWFIIASLMNKPINIFGNGKQVRDMLFADDAVRAYDLFIKSNLKHQVFNLGGGKENTISLLEFLDILKEKTGKEMQMTFKDWRPSDQKVYISDTSKVKEKLGWQPEISVNDGIQTLMDWAKENKEMFQD